MATELNPPNSDAVIVAADDEAAETYKAAGFTEVKAKRSTRKADDK